MINNNMKKNDKKTYYQRIRDCGCTVELSRIKITKLDDGDSIKRLKITYDEFLSMAMGLVACGCEKRMNRDEAIKKRQELYRKVSCGRKYNNKTSRFIYVCGENGHCDDCKKLDIDIEKLNKIINKR